MRKHLMYSLLCIYFVLPLTAQTTQKPEQQSTATQGAPEENVQTQKNNPAANPAAVTPTETPEEAPKETKPMTDKEKEEHEKQQKRDKTGTEYITKTLDYGTHKERAQAVANIKNIKTEPYLSEVLSLMVKNIKDETDPEVLRKSFQIAADYERKDAIGPISAYITHENENVQIAAVYALKDLKASGKSLEMKSLLKSLDFSENAGLIEALLLALGDFEDKTLFEFTKQKIEDPKTSDFNRQRLILFLGNSKTLESSDYLKELFTNEDENITIRSYAVSSLSKFGNSSVVPAIN